MDTVPLTIEDLRQQEYCKLDKLSKKVYKLKDEEKLFDLVMAKAAKLTNAAANAAIRKIKDDAKLLEIALNPKLADAPIMLAASRMNMDADTILKEVFNNSFANPRNRELIARAIAKRETSSIEELEQKIKILDFAKRRDCNKYVRKVAEEALKNL